DGSVGGSRIPGRPREGVQAGGVRADPRRSSAHRAPEAIAGPPDLTYHRAVTPAADRGAARSRCLSDKARTVGRIAVAVAVVVLLATVSAAASRGSSAKTVNAPYWVGNFRHGTYCQFATVFQSTTVNPAMSPEGYIPACAYT